MPAVNFKEISEAHIASCEQDSFELFARDFLDYMGYKVLEGPDRGPDGGRDMIVLEIRKGIGGESSIRWLVSCKHKAHSGKAVSVSDEPDIIERVKQKKCDGFIGFYSTVPSTPLADRLKALEKKVQTQYFDREKIESYLLRSPDGLLLFKRYFPNSYAKWNEEDDSPAKILSDQDTLRCGYCGKDLLKSKTGIVVIWENYKATPRQVVDIYWSCKGECDRHLKVQHQRSGLIDGWEDIPDICTPVVFIKWVMATFNEFHQGDKYSEEAFIKLKSFFLAVFPYVTRKLNAKDMERLKIQLRIPSYLGGLGE